MISTLNLTDTVFSSSMMISYALLLALIETQTFLDSRLRTCAST
jgi:hypothetical protein